MYMQKFVDGGPAQQVTQFQPTFSPAQQGLGSIQQAPNVPAMESSPTDYNQSSQYAPTQQYSAPAANPMTAGLGSYLQGLEYKAPPPAAPPTATGATGGTYYDPKTQPYGVVPVSTNTPTSTPDKYANMPSGLTYGGERTYGNEDIGYSSEPIFTDASGRSVYYSPAVGGEDPQAASYYYKNETEDGGYNLQTYVPNKAGGRIRAYAQGGSIPQGIASLGRGQDSMLVHMTPGEVQGLQRLAMAHGGSLTINPQTGLPEAGFLSSLLPMIAGAGLMLIPGMQPLGAAAITGGLTALTSGSLKKGLMAGLGAYGGAGLGGGLAEMGAEQAQKLADAETNAAADLVGKQAQKTAFDAETAKQATATENAAGSSTQTLYPSKITNTAYDESGASWGSRTPTTYTESEYWGPVVQTPPPTFSQTPAQVAEAARRIAIDDAELSFRPLETSPAGQALARGPAGNAFEGFKQLGTKEGLKTLGGKLGYAGMAGLAAPFLSSAMEPSKFNPPANRQAQYYNTSYTPPRYNPQTGMYEPASYGSGSYYTNPTQYAAQGGAVGYDQGGMARFYPLTGDKVDMSAAPGGLGGRGEKPDYSRDMYGNDSGAGINDNKAGKGPYSNAGGIYENTPSSIESLFANISAANLVKHLKSKSAALQAAAIKELRKRANAVNDYGIEDTTSAAQGGLMGLNTYAAGGKLLRGPGDGMSDSIPAVIQGAKPQRAALADGEFVIPADVVSHLGNGSTQAGSKRLYSMMDKVRRARTGNPKQGKQINPDQFMPA